MKKTMLILATVGAFALMTGTANASCASKPSVEKLAVGKNSTICRTKPGHDAAGNSGGESEGGRGEGPGEGQGGGAETS